MAAAKTEDDGVEEAGDSETVTGSEEVVVVDAAEDVSGSLETAGWEAVSELFSLDVSALSTVLLIADDVSSCPPPHPAQDPIPAMTNTTRIIGISMVVTFDFFFVFTFGSPFNYKMIV